MDVNQYLDIFLEESKEHLQQLNEKLLLLEADNKNINLINEIFRSAHTLKGMAATMGFAKMATLTHEMESLLDLVRNNKRLIDSEIMDTLFHSIDILEQMVILINDAGNDEHDITEIVNKLNNLAIGKNVSLANDVKLESDNEMILTFDEYERTVLKQSLESQFSIYQIRVEIEEETVLKSARAYMVYHDLEELGEVFKTYPSVEVIENEDFGNIFYIVLITKATGDELKSAVLRISEIADATIIPITDLEFKLNNKTSSSQFNENKAEGIQEKTNNKLEDASSKGLNSKMHGKMIRVDIERLDELMNLFSELVIDKGRLEQLANEVKNPGLTETVEHMSRISSSLQTNILNLRMVSIEQVFNRFPRMVRDLSKELNKKVNLNISGANTELDRTVIDEIGDPLVHLLRNSVDHGLETTEERLRANKPEEGQLTLKAYHSSNFVFIEVSDDGRGIDRDKVLKKAIEKGLITQEISSTFTDKQVLDLLFSSGLSTAETISDISGRGVGLDVVKSKIESLGGFVTVDSELGKGTKFTIQLPLTLSIISTMLVTINEEEYAIPLSSIIETAIYKKSEIMTAHSQEVIDFRGRIVPLVYLSKIFKVPKKTEEIDKSEVAILIVRKGDKIAGLVVDSFIGQQEVVLKSLGNYLTNVFAISGATILGDGQVTLIIDTNSLIK